jgi:hypothetical protein
MMSNLSRFTRAMRSALSSRSIDERGMATVEYAMVTIAAAAFAAVLIAIIRSPEVREALLGIVSQALSGA